LQKVGVAIRKVTLYLLDQRADGLRVQRIGMIDDAHAIHRGHPQPGHESKGVKEGQDAEDLVFSAEHEDLR
jgi:hypothetical protein